MNKLFLLVVISVSANIFSYSQTDDYNKNEYYVGYSNLQYDNGQRRTFNGFEVSYVRNFHRYFGSKADFSGSYYRRKDFSGNAIADYKQSTYNILGGIQIKDNASNARIKPFGHFLIGVANDRNRLNCSNCGTPNFRVSYTGIAGAIGGGLDIKLSDKINLRAIQADYNPTHTGAFTKNNIRLGIGISFK